jgi:AraC family transcriptional regulator of adaptative response/methylated-DNA-[protein]-cysteine methyltransferase
MTVDLLHADPLLASSASSASSATLSDDRSDDYALVRKAITIMSEHWREQPTVEAIAARVGLGAEPLQRLFMRWAGLTPKAFLQALTLDAARELLRESVSVLDTSYELGMSGPGRLHDLFVTHEAMTPGAYRARGRGLLMRWGFHRSPFGAAIIVVTEHGLAGLGFADEGEEETALADMAARWPAADLIEDAAATAPYAARIFDPSEWTVDRPLNVVLIGTDFEIRVWRTLLKIPMGRATSYSDIADHVGSPKAHRAVGSAVGRNPISFVVPCHRVLGRSGDLCGYHWGLTRKRAILGWETGRISGAR